ncbi:MAG TPA: diguanylate cyclase [Pelovirga sp.]|nr:diguanylate cyclase [Pelovirga sp.]
MRVLVAEDDPALLTLLKKNLIYWGYDVVAVAEGNAALDVLQSDNPPGMALLDWMMPGLTGVEVCQRIRAEEKDSYTYIMMLTCLQRDEDLMTGLEAGADDYMFKPFKQHELRLRLRTGQRIIELQDELRQARNDFRTKALHDPLTGLLNHGEILRNLAHELDRAEREGKQVGVIMADIDNFKQINDTYGHLAGDMVLRTIATKMHSLMRSYDFIGRYGGEEFLVVLPDCNPEYAASFAERLRLAVSTDTIDNTDNGLAVTISFGVAASDINQSKGIDALVKAADDALYQAKKYGRNRVEVARVAAEIE